MVKVILSHEVKDFATWKQGFDADDANRSAKGVKITGVYTALDNPNYVSITSEFASMEALKGMMDSPEMQATMEKAGVVGKPVVQVMQ